jgi:UDP-glucose 4-epimerase
MPPHRVQDVVAGEDMPRRVPDISKIRALVGYEPTVHLDEILTRVIASLRT